MPIKQHFLVEKISNEGTYTLHITVSIMSQQSTYSRNQLKFKVVNTVVVEGCPDNRKLWRYWHP